MSRRWSHRSTVRPRDIGAMRKFVVERWSCAQSVMLDETTVRSGYPPPAIAEATGSALPLALFAAQGTPR